MLPPGSTNRRPRRVGNIEADTGLQHPLSTLHERRRRHPCKTRFRLAGCASTGRASNPLDRCERFQVTFPSSLPGFALSQVESSRNSTLRELDTDFRSMRAAITSGDRSHAASPEIDPIAELKRSISGRWTVEANRAATLQCLQ